MKLSSQQNEPQKAYSDTVSDESIEEINYHSEADNDLIGPKPNF